MKLVFDAHWWVDGPTANRHVLREMVHGWSRRFPDDELVLVTRADQTPDLDTALSGPVSVFPVRWRPHAIAAGRTGAIADRLHADAVVTQNFATRTRRAVSATYLHDVLFKTNPEWFSTLERAYFSRMIAWAPRADVVFASTRTEADRIRRSTAARRVVPVGLGLSRELVLGDLDHDPSLAAGEFVLTVGRLNARKNLEQTIRSALASGVVSPAHPLVIVGSPGGLREDVSASLEQAEIESLRFTGHVSEARLRWLYQTCSAFVYLSRGEGYGMPPVEAAAFGRPIVVSDIPVFHETLGGIPVGFIELDDVASAARTIAVAVERGRTDIRRASSAIAPRVDIGDDWDDVVDRMRAELHSIRSPSSVRGPRPARLPMHEERL
jgi:glycosyltransferase involved in cell wall biosynthesis